MEEEYIKNNYCILNLGSMSIVEFSKVEKHGSSPNGYYLHLPDGHISFATISKFDDVILVARNRYIWLKKSYLNKYLTIEQVKLQKKIKNVENDLVKKINKLKELEELKSGVLVEYAEYYI